MELGEQIWKILDEWSMGKCTQGSAVQAIVKIVELHFPNMQTYKDVIQENAVFRTSFWQIQEVLEQPLDRISEITKEDYAEVRGKVLDIARRALGCPVCGSTIDGHTCKGGKR